MAKVLVIGASRGIGKAVCLAAAGNGHDVHAMSRSGHTPKTRSGTITPVRGDALNPSDVEEALRGVDIVVQALGVSASLSLITGPVTLFSEATQVLLPLMEKVGVTRLIAVTGFGAGDCAAAVNPLQRIPFRALLGRAYDDKSIQEALIEESSLDWLIVRPGVLTNGQKTDRYRVLENPGEWRNGIISRADVADFISRQIDADQLGRRKPVLIRYPL